MKHQSLTFAYETASFFLFRGADSQEFKEWAAGHLV